MDMWEDDLFFLIRFCFLSIFEKFLSFFDIFVYKVVLFQLTAKDVPEPAAPAVAPVDDDDAGSGAGSTGRKAGCVVTWCIGSTHG